MFERGIVCRLAGVFKTGAADQQRFSTARWRIPAELFDLQLRYRKCPRIGSPADFGRLFDNRRSVHSQQYGGQRRRALR
jgi:hypothetical protein